MAGIARSAEPGRGRCRLTCSGVLAVNFQEVVHSVRTGNADVAKPQCIAEGSNGHPQECQRHTGKQIAAEVGVSPATVCRVLKRRGLNKLSALEPADPIRRYERE